MAALQALYEELKAEKLAKLQSDKLVVLRETPQIRMLHTVIRDREMPRADFIFSADRLNRLLIEEGMNLLPMEQDMCITPTESVFDGLKPGARICGVSILRSGEAMEKGLRQVCKDIRIGKILIQRNEVTKQPKLIYVKLPEDIKERFVLLMDPMLATGGSACTAIDVLEKAGVPQEHIIFLNLIAAPEGLDVVLNQYPRVRIVTTMVDQGLNEHAYIVPGIGDFGDRYFGT